MLKNNNAVSVALQTAKTAAIEFLLIALLCIPAALVIQKGYAEQAHMEWICIIAVFTSAAAVTALYAKRKETARIVPFAASTVIAIVALLGTLAGESHRPDLRITIEIAAALYMGPLIYMLRPSKTRSKKRQKRIK